MLVGCCKDFNETFVILIVQGFIDFDDSVDGPGEVALVNPYRLNILWIFISAMWWVWPCMIYGIYYIKHKRSYSKSSIYVIKQNKQ